MTETAKLTASDGQANDEFGYSVAISGNTVVVAAEFATVGTSAQGAAYVFTEPSSGWADMTQTAKLTASDGAAGDGFGCSVSISGNTAVVGADTAHGVNGPQGAAYVFDQPHSGWTNMTQTAKLTASDGQANDEFGCSVSISGSTAVVGAFAATVGINSHQGAAYVFTQPSSGWTNMTQTAKLTASDGQANDEFGCSVAVSGNAAVVGAAYATVGANDYQGAAYVFTEHGSHWANMTQTAKLTASDGQADDEFGTSVAISGDTVVVGEEMAQIGANDFQGAAYVFTMPNSGWTNMTETAKLTAPDGQADDFFGCSVSVSGNTVVVGALELGANNGGGGGQGGGGGDQGGGGGNDQGGGGDTTGGGGDTTGGGGGDCGGGGDSGGGDCGGEGIRVATMAVTRVMAAIRVATAAMVATIRAATAAMAATTVETTVETMVATSPVPSPARRRQSKRPLPTPPQTTVKGRPTCSRLPPLSRQCPQPRSPTRVTPWDRQFRSRSRSTRRSR